MAEIADIASLRHALRDRVARVENEAEKRASVAAIFRQSDAGPEVLLIRRAERVRDPWSGQMAFPGGRQSPTDADSLDTAIRETREEIGLDLRDHATLLGRLDDVHAIARGVRVGLVISVFVFELHGAPATSLDAVEVAEVVWAKVLPMSRGELDTKYPYVYEGQPIGLPAFRVGEHIVWGLTFKMLTELFATVSAALP